MFCGEDTLIGVGPDDVCLKPLLCKRWSCDTCMPHRIRQLRFLAASGEPTTLITLTCRPSRYNDPCEAAQDLVRCWKNVRQRLTREGKAKKLPFLAVIEATKAGWPHLHILCRAPFIPQRWLSAAADKYIGAPIVDIRRVYNRRHASRYIAKYVSKGPGHYRGCKRYWRSQDYAGPAVKERPIADANRTWWRERESFDSLLWNLQNCDWHHRHETTGPAILAPGLKARWLWFDHPPPSACEVHPCRPVTLNP